jgi:glycosyltransferase involved in cell wall biosynthesis
MNTEIEGAAEEKIGVVVVAYNAASTLVQVLDRLPQSFRDRVSDIVVCDDASSDTTYEIGLEYQAKSELPLTVIRRPQNLGYGGNQKAAYAWAIERGLDIVVLLHGDGQYAPEVIEDIVRPFAETDADAVFGSRMLNKGGARSGGMPMYKFVGNKILSTFSNAVTGLRLSEWHSGYRAYRTSALAELPLEVNSDGFDFDTEIILQLLEGGKKIIEVPIPTYYGDEICYVDGMGYAKDVVVDVLRYRSHKMGFGTGELAFAEEGYNLKLSTAADSSHQQLLTWMGDGGPKKVLDLGCSHGQFGELLRLQGHTVIGVDMEKLDGVAERLDGFIEANLNEGLPAEVGTDFDVVIGADVFEHLPEPQKVLVDIQRALSPRGVILVSIPNIGHWYARGKVALGAFDYERRGIFDAGHLRFFTSKSFIRMAKKAGLRVRRETSVGLPVAAVERGGPAPTRTLRTVGAIDRFGLKFAPSLFSYQLLFELEPDE